MLAKVWFSLSNAGIYSNLDSSKSRYVILTNRFVIITSLIGLSLLVLLFIGIPGTGWTLTRIQILVGSFMFLGVILLNKAGFHNISRWIISWLPVLVILYISLTHRIFLRDSVVMKDFFTYRFLIMATAIIPLLVFSTREIFILIVNLIPSFIGVVFFDQIHALFDVGLSQFGYDAPYMYILDITIAFAYFGMVGFILSQRFVMDKFELKLNQQQEILQEKNGELKHKNSFIIEQNHEIVAQSDRLKEINDALIEAQKIIEDQKQQLVDQNKNLEVQVIEKTKDLSRVNEELIINNNELRQFSHTLSHNLKSPVATFQGLLNLFERNELSEANKELLTYLDQSVDNMQEVFSDMNAMLELRNRLYTSIDHVDIQKEIDRLHNNFYLELRKNNIRFDCNCNGVKYINTNEKRLNGILFQLINNAIKFRSDKRDPEIKIKLNGTSEYHSIKIWDNGIGIDLEKYANKLFYPYQKFNSHTGGKGLGLYLVKLQTESLGGSVSIQSEPDIFTEVEIRLQK